MRLSEQRCLFSRLISELVLWVPNNLPGHVLAFNEVKREPATTIANAEKGTGIASSLHLSGLAADMLLYIDGVYATSTEAHRRIGEHWKTLHPLNRWGGDFHSRPDGNHYSSERDGIR